MIFTESARTLFLSSIHFALKSQSVSVQIPDRRDKVYCHRIFQQFFGRAYMQEQQYILFEDIWIGVIANMILIQ